MQVICWKSLRDAQRKELLNSRLMIVHGKWQRDGEAKNLIAGRLEEATALLGSLATESRNFRRCMVFTSVNVVASYAR